MAKSITTYYINSDLLDSFDKAKGKFKKSHLVEFWISEFLKNKDEFVPKTENKVTVGFPEPQISGK